MKLMDKVNNKMKNMVKKWLDIRPAQSRQILINEPLSFETNVLRNLIWYRGEAEEIEQFFQAVGQTTLAQQRFWAAAGYTDDIRKAHSGLPAVIADNLSQLIATDIQNAEFSGKDSKELQGRWENIRKENEFPKLLVKSIKDVLVTGDGAFKINVDSDISKLPIIEFYDASRVEYEMKNGRITGVVFISYHWEDDKEYILKEFYRKNSISYKLYQDDKEMPLSKVQRLKDLQPVTFAGDYMMAVPVMVWPSARFAGRGKSIFDNKTDSFDAFDEIISQWMDAIRAGRVKHYIPEDMIPRGDGGRLQSVDSFGSKFIKIDVPNSENAKHQIDTVQPEIRYEAFLSSYSTILDNCLQGIISPATLGINVGKMSSDESQREKKDITGVTRNAVTQVLEKAIPQLINYCLMTEDNINQHTPGYYDAAVSFGEYGAPDFDSRVNTVSTAATSGVMSTEAVVDELWGNSKDDKWKEQEVRRILKEKGIDMMDEPAVGTEIV